MISKRIAAARIKLSSIMPYLSTGIWAMEPIKTDHDFVMGADQYWRLYYNEQKIEEFSVNELSAILAHELMHLIRDHAGRCKRQDLSHELFSVASDMEINDDLRSQRLPLPEGSLFPEDFDLEEEKLAEWYYERLGDNAIPLGQALQYGGSCADGDSREYELPEPGMEGPKGDEEQGEAPQSLPGVNKPEGDLLRKKISEDVKQAAKQRGDVPGNLARWAEGFDTPKVNWKKVLSATIRRAISFSQGMTDYSYQRPSRRRSVHGNIIMPGMVNPNISVAVVIDTSGSMSSKELSMAVTEVGGILKSHVGREGVQVLSVDSAASSAKKVFSRKNITLTGGGGTDMGVGIQAVEKMKPKPDFCIVITDGWTPWPSKAPTVKVIIALTEESMRHKSPSYAKTVVIE